MGGQKFHLQPRDLQVEKILTEGKNNPNIPGVALTQNCLKSVFESSRTYGLFTAYFDEEFYRYAEDFYYNKNYARYSAMNAVVGVTRVLEAVEISQRNNSPYCDVQRFLTEDFAQIHDDAKVYSQVIDRFSRYITATVMVRLYQNNNSEALQILSMSDNKAKISKPEYHQKDGVCYLIRSYIGSLEIVTKALEDGQARVYLSAPYVTEQENRSKHIPYWIDYTKLTINGKVIFDTLTPVWHDKSYRHIMDVKAGEEIKIQAEWLPHRSDT